MGERDPMADWPTGRLLSTASRLVEHAWIDGLESLGLTHAGLIVLDLLDRGALSQAELARQARVQAQTMSRTLERLERAGYVVRQQHPDDGRRHAVTRTDAGRTAWASARTLEAEIFPARADTPGLRSALLEIIRSGSAARW